MHRSAQEQCELIEAYRSSGLSKSAFCRRQNIHLPTFCGWLKKMPAFAEVSLPAEGPGVAPRSGARMHIDLPHGLCVHIHDVSSLKELAPFIREILAC